MSPFAVCSLVNLVLFGCWCWLARSNARLRREVERWADETAATVVACDLHQLVGRHPSTERCAERPDGSGPVARCWLAAGHDGPHAIPGLQWGNGE